MAQLVCRGCAGGGRWHYGGPGHAAALAIYCWVGCAAHLRARQVENMLLDPSCKSLRAAGGAGGTILERAFKCRVACEASHLHTCSLHPTGRGWRQRWHSLRATSAVQRLLQSALWRAALIHAQPWWRMLYRLADPIAGIVMHRAIGAAQSTLLLHERKVTACSPLTAWSSCPLATVKVAADIAAKSPLAVSGTKRILLHTRDCAGAGSSALGGGLDYVATYNSAVLLSEDISGIMEARASRTAPRFSKL